MGWRVTNAESGKRDASQAGVKVREEAGISRDHGQSLGKH